jgi:DNA sulfur modification protein DndE
MKRILVGLLVSGFGLLGALTDKEVEELGVEAYIYGYPLVTMDQTKQVMTNTVVPMEGRAPVGQFVHMREFPDPSMKYVTTPNADTLYSTAWLDLTLEPWVLHIPDVGDRYYLLQMLDGWTNVFADPGTRIGTKAGDYAITGPNWKGQLPTNVKEFKSPTNLAWVIGRTYTTGTPEDYVKVHQIQDQYTLTPLSSFGTAYVPPKGVFDPNIDMKTAVRDQVNLMTAPTFFNQLALLMQGNPPAAADAPAVAKLAKLGIVPGEDFDPSKLGAAGEKALEHVPKLALERIMAEKKQQKLVNGWFMDLRTGNYGTDYLYRALVTAIGLGANLPEDAVYPATSVDSKGNPLIGASSYVLHFDKDKLPPVKGFWSLTMYDDQFFFVANPLKRYRLSPANNLKYNPDGSLDLYLQSESPGAEKESNWLPAPKGLFNLVLRLYWPEKSILEGTWQPPAVNLVK